MSFSCPLCHAPLSRSERSFSCPQRHQFDIAKEGYVNLLPVQHKRSRDPGDSAEMMQARRAFLDAGHYQPLRDAIAEKLHAALPASAPAVLDIGCGEGYYTNALARSQTQWIGLDLSKAALKIASKSSSVTYFCASIAETPLMDKCMDGALCIFAPYNLDEVYRIVKADGYFITVNPGPRHLYGLKEVLYDEVRLNPSNTIDDPRFHLITSKILNHELFLDNGEMIQNLLTMTPYRFKTSPAALDRLKLKDTLETELSFIIELYQMH